MLCLKRLGNGVLFRGRGFNGGKSLHPVFVMTQCCRAIAAEYPDIVYEEVIIDNACMMVSMSQWLDSCIPELLPAFYVVLMCFGRIGLICSSCALRFSCR